MKEKRIKIVIASHGIGAGHGVLGDLMFEELRNADGFDPVHVQEDGGKADVFYGFLIKHADFYMKLTHRLGQLPLLDWLSYFQNNALYAPAARILREHEPDLVIATRFSQSIPYAAARRALKFPTAVINAVPDYGPPSRNDFPRLPCFKPDYLMVMERESFDGALRKFRLDGGRVVLLGHDTRKEFRWFRDSGATKKTAREKFLSSYGNSGLLRGFDPLKKTVLIMGGSKAAARTFPVIRGILRASSEILSRAQYAVACGTDPEFFEKLMSLKNSRKDMEHVFPFPHLSVDKMAGLMAGSDHSVLGSLAPITMEELCETRCLPLIIFRHIAHEAPHVRYVKKEGIGFYEPRVRDCLQRMEYVLMMNNGMREKYIRKADNLRIRHRERFRTLPRILKRICDGRGRPHAERI